MVSHKETHCVECGKELSGRQRRFCSKKCKARNTGNSYENQQERALQRKTQLVDLKGGSCENCGYRNNLAALCFHHLDPSKKELHLDVRTLSNTSMEKLVAETEKCSLLCHNCHMEVHYPALSRLL